MTWFEPFLNELRTETVNVIKDTKTEDMREYIDKHTQNVLSEYQNEIRIIKGQIDAIYINLITILGIFVAIVMLFFGGLQIIDSFANLSQQSIWRFVFSVSSMGFVVFVMFFVFIVSIAKMTNKTIDISCNKNGGEDCTHCIHRHKKKFFDSSQKEATTIIKSSFFCKCKRRYPHFFWPIIATFSFMVLSILLSDEFAETVIRIFNYIR